MFQIPLPRVLLLGLGLMSTTLVLAQTPANPDPGSFPPPVPHYSSPPEFPAPPDFPAPPGYMSPGGYGFQPPPPPDFSAPPTMPGPDRGGQGRVGGPLRFNQSVTPEGYVLEIPLDGMKAEEIQVDVDGRSLRISRDTSAKMSREDNFDDGRGYMRSFSYSSGRSSRRIPLPPDADGAAMQRQDSPEQVRILIPRRKG